jgi:hypothetical protein
MMPVKIIWRKEFHAIAVIVGPLPIANVAEHVRNMQLDVGSLRLATEAITALRWDKRLKYPPKH